MPPLTTQILKSTCSYCGVGCGIEILKHRTGQLELRGDASHPANRGMLCSKGRSLLHTVHSTDTRLRYPHLRPTRTEDPQRATWNDALSHIAAQFQRIVAQHGPDAVAFYASGQCLTEEYYLVNKIAKGFLGTNNIDTNSRLCMSSAVCGYKATLGADGPPVCYDDIDSCDTFFIAGANPAWCHPVLFRRIEARKAADPNVRIIVADPRRTASCAAADLHLPLRPGTDVALFLGIARHLWRTGQVDHAFIEQHLSGWDAYLESLAPWTLARTASTCGLPERDIARAADWLGGDGGGRRFLSLWTMGLNQSAVGTDKNTALIALSLITGKIGKPGCGPFSLTGQPNAMGGREVGGMATLLSAHRDLANPEHRAQVAHFWDVPASRLSPKPGLTAVELFDALRAGSVKAVWIIATNPIASLPDAWRAEAALRNAELVVVQDIYPTETADFADVILPAAGWLEKPGTMTNADRRISLLEKAIEPPGEALPDADILIRFAHAMGWQKHFDYRSVADVFAEHAALTAGTDIDITALSHDVLRQRGPTQWPAPKLSELMTQNSELLGTPRLYTDHQFPTPDRRAMLPTLKFEDRSEPLSPEFPLILTTGRIRDQWHTMTKTGQVNKLSAHIDSPYCEIHPDDAAPRRIEDGSIVTVASSRGDVQLRAVLTPDIRPGVIFLPMHWGKRLAGSKGRANNLTSPRLDPASKEPDLKFAAVQVTRFVPAARRIVIVGGGAACAAFIENHRRHNDRDQITVFAAEPQPIYSRVLLPHYIDGTRSFDSIVRADRAFFEDHRITFHAGTPIARIDRANKTVIDESGRAHPYDILFLATGSRPAIHYDGPMPASGVYTLRSRADADRILAAASSARHIVINGGGLLGLELADALAHLGCRVSILQRSDRLMGKQLDAAAAAHLAEEMRDRGIHIFFHALLTSIPQHEALDHILVDLPGSPLPSRVTIPCDMLIFATGIVPNKELAGAALLDCDRGILVNAHLQTSDPSIFAIGECAQLGELTFGTTPAAEAQARAATEFLRGNLHAPYRGTVTANILKVHGLSLASAGRTDIPADDPLAPEIETLILHDPRKRYYQKLLIHRDRLIGALCLGDTRCFGEYLDLISSGRELEESRDTLLRPIAETASQPLEGPLICSCHHIGEGTIARAIAAHGPDLQKLRAHTRAGTGCGSCKPEIHRLIQRTTVAPPPAETLPKLRHTPLAIRPHPATASIGPSLE